MKKVVLLTGHYFGSKRKAGFHFLANAFLEKGNEVVFITSVFSFLKIIKNDYRLHENGFLENILKPRYINGVKSLVNFTILHPVNKNSNLMEDVSSFCYKLNRRVRKELADADIIVFESVQSILFFEEIVRINPAAKKIYRMSDDMEAINFPQNVVNYEREIVDSFDLVSIPNKVMFDKFYDFTPNNIRLEYHGIDKKIFNTKEESPYGKSINHVFVGNSYLDESFVRIASSIFPNHTFHIIGPFSKSVMSNNVIYYGQMPFEETIKYIKHADIGLQIMRDRRPDILKTLGDSLKVLQYTYCGLPIVAPLGINASHRFNVYYYRYDDFYSIKKSIEDALLLKSTNSLEIKDWGDLVDGMMQIPKR